MNRAAPFSGIIGDPAFDKDIAEWVARGIGSGGQAGWFQEARCIGIIDKDNIIAGIVYSDIRDDVQGNPLSCSMSIYSVDKKWANRHNLRELFRFPFIQLGLKRVHTVCSAEKAEIMKFNKRLGFKQEGVHRMAWPLGGDSVSFGMIKENCRWL